MSAKRLRYAVALAAIAAVCVARPRALATQSADPALSDVLSAAARYVSDYEKSFGAIAADERYVQTANSIALPTASKREMNCAVLMFNTGEAGWMAFREVMRVDTKQLSDDSGRLAALAANPTREALVRAMQTTETSRSYVLGPLARPFAVPPSALVFLRAAQQSRSTFELDGFKTVGKLRAALVKFGERPAGQMIATGEQSTTSGRFWIEPGTGRVVQTELTIATGGYQARTEVDYASQPGLEIWVPVRLIEQFTVTAGGAAHGLAPTTAYTDGLSTYSNFKKFDAKPLLLIR